MQITKRAMSNSNGVGETISEKAVSLSSLQELGLVSLLLIAVLVVFLGKSLLPGMVMSAADGTFATPFFDSVKPAEFGEPSNSLLFDQVYQFTPWRYYAWKSLNDGQIPLWNPYSSSGTPFLATMQSAVFYPINLLLTFLPFEATLAWSAFLRLWIAGITTYLLMRRYMVGRSASFIASISFMLCGYLVVWLGHPQTNVAIWLPTLLLLAEVLLNASGKRKILFVMACVGLVVGIQFLGGHIETSVDVIFAVGLYYIFRWSVIILPQKRSLFFKLQYLIGVPISLFALGFAVAAVQLAPFLEWLSVGTEFNNRGGFSTGFHLIDGSVWRHLLELPVILFPNLYNNPTWNAYPYWSFYPLEGNFNENILYVGTLVLLLAFIGICTRWKHEPLVKIWSMIALICFGRAFHLPIFDWLNHMPILSLENPDRLRLDVAFSLCVLAGFGAEKLWTSRLPNQSVVLRKLWIWSSLFVLVVGLITLILGNTVLPTLADRVRTFGRERVESELAKRDTPPQYPMEHYYAEVDQMVDGLLAGFRFDNIEMYMPMLWAAAGLLCLSVFWRYAWFHVEWLKFLIITLVTIDLISFGGDYNPSVPAEHFYPDTAISKQIANDETLFRFTALRQDLIPDAHMLFGLQDVRGLDFPTSWYDQYMGLVPERIPWLPYGIILSSVDSPLLKVLNIKYVVAAKAEPLEQDKDIKIVGQSGNMYLGEVANVAPRAFMVYDAIYASNDEQVLAALNDEPGSVTDRVILSEAKNAPVLSNEPIAPNGDLDQVDMSEYASDHSTWKVSTAQNGYLFLSDTYYPGWKAYLDDEPVELYRANMAFRAVYVPRGEHVVSFRYEPYSVRLGAIISMISLAAIFITLILTRKSAFQPERPDPSAS